MTAKLQAIPPTGCQRLTNGGLSKELLTFAAWQSPDLTVPKRVVIRCDGLENDYRDADGAPGFPCGVAIVRITIGGLTKEVKVDCLTQSALVVWANSVDVTAHRDEARVTALAAWNVKPAANQTIAAAISSACDCGDSGSADARYLCPVDLNPEADQPQFLVFEVPHSARLLRLLPGASSAPALVDWSAGGVVYFSANDPIKTSSLVGMIEAADATSTRRTFTVPANARFMVLVIPAGEALATLDQIPWLEWVLAPSSVRVE